MASFSKMSSTDLEFKLGPINACMMVIGIWVSVQDMESAFTLMIANTRVISSTI